MSKYLETMAILAEECAEVIVAISKINRFGFENVKPGQEKTNREHLAEEIGDTLAMVELLISSGVITSESVEQSKIAKLEKLKIWSKIFE
jgi:NTP pyrophosphatase (non-canonical NTP hydrolase)